MRSPVPIPALLAVLAMLVAASLQHAQAQMSRTYPPDFPAELPEGFDLDPSFQVMPPSQAARIAQSRFDGKLISARLVPPRREERKAGTELVHELRLLTKRRDVIVIRLDAEDGRFLEVAGSGLVEARRAPDPAAATALGRTKDKKPDGNTHD